MAAELVQYLRRVVQAELETLTDAQLLQRYVATRDGAAFAVLVRRHAAMVWSVCQRALGHNQNAEDAFQATFVVLVKKAASVRPPDLLGNWLYGVARQIARKARALNARTSIREQQLATALLNAEARPDAWSELGPILDHELGLLPEKYRAVLVLCDLEGKTRREAAHCLGVPEGTVAGRHARARRLLAKRLARRGFAVGCGALAATLSQTAEAAPAPAVAAAIRSADALATGEILAANVITLAQGALKILFLRKLASASVLVLAILGLGLGAARFSGVLAQEAAGTPDPTGKPNRENAPEPEMGRAAVGPVLVTSERVAPRGTESAAGEAVIDPARGSSTLKYEIGADPIQPAGSPVLMRLVLTNTGKERIHFLITGPGPYPPLSVKAKVTDAAGKTRELPLTNGQALGISGVAKSLAPGESMVTPATLAPLPKGSYRIAVEGGSVRVTVEASAELLRKRDGDLLARVGAGEPFARHVVSTYLTPELRDHCLRDLTSSDERTATRLATVLAQAPRLPDESMPLLARAVDGHRGRLAAARSTDHDLWNALTGMAAKNGSDQALELVIRVAGDASNVSAGAGIRALGAFRQQRAAETLRRFLQDADASRGDLAALTLADRRDEACLEVLLALAENRKSSWRGLACLALVNFPTDPRVEPAIRSCLDDPECGGEASEALRKLGSAKQHHTGHGRVEQALPAARVEPRGAEPPVDAVEQALAAYCAKHQLKRATLESYPLDLIPGTKVFRYELPAVQGKEFWMVLPVRFAFVFVDARTGRLLALQRTDFEQTAPALYQPLYEAMKRAGRKVKTAKEATAVMRSLVLLDGYLGSAKTDPGSANWAEAGGRYRGRPNTFFGGIHGWAGGDDVGLEVDAEGYVKALLGGHVR